MSRIVASVLFLTLWLGSSTGQIPSGKVVCFYDSRAYYREDSGKFLVADLEHALASCTHVIYGYAKLDGEDFKVKPMDPALETDEGNGNYKAVTSLKKRFPGIQFLVSVGGWADKEGDKEKYLTLLRDPNHRGTFVSSARALIQQYGFDGIDLAWQFPLVRVKQRSKLGSIWHKIKKTFGYAKGSKDLQAEEHKAGFTALIKQLKMTFRSDGYSVTASVIPHTNYSIYFDPKEQGPYLDAVHLFAFDFLTAERKITPEVADYPAPLYASYDRNPDFNVDHMVTWFINNSMPANKLIVGVPTYGRTWRLTGDSTITGVPPLEADGEGAEGHLTHSRGLLSYPEICAMLSNPNNHGTKGLLRKVIDPTKKLGTYAFRTDESDREGIWVGYEDPDTTATKAAYARSKGLGGVAIVDVTLDDFRGVCTGDRFPLLRAAKQAI
ncbi:UNVERIFIED_CONTAM: hypothetical protein PYX00_007630 [Menopon gallinae]|uniref:GH18 domain-containing protein n=1 Tax=Menopon gallinae TaxID=328185 RepID=A0AAW2HKI7_9NEOP